MKKLFSYVVTAAKFTCPFILLHLLLFPTLLSYTCPMVPHDASHLHDDLDDESEMGLMNEYAYSFKPQQPDGDGSENASLLSEESTSGRRARRRSGGAADLEFKPEIDTGGVSDSCFSFKKLWKYTGPGWLMSIAYLDPGNLESDLQAGAIAGYSLLWLLFWAHVTGLAFQLLSARLGTVTGQHLAQLIRQSYTTRMSVVLWAFAQIAIIGADIMEIIGTAIALHILLRLPLWVGVLITTVDTFTFMMIQRYGMRKMEAFFMMLILVMTTCFWVEMVVSKPDVAQIFRGLAVPVVPKNAVVQAVGMLGAVVMPHNMFLHSALVGSRDLGAEPTVRKRKEANFYFGIESGLALFLSFLVNLAIVVVFAQVFYKPDAPDNIDLPGLADADAVLKRTLGSAAQYLWGAGLLAAGQSSTMTGTFAGQYVTEGFFGNMFRKDWHRVAITRGISLIPSMLVAVFAVDHFDTMGELLNVLQSVCLPPVLIPILKLCSSTAVMSAEFTTSTVLHVICWLLTGVVVGFNVFLFVTHITSVWSFVMIGAFGLVYLAFLAYMVWLPLDYVPKGANSDDDGWMAIPENSDDEEISLRQEP
ncbi:natural resistance-associated macrophage protein-domain-containing protein [Zychaea mexicana]|uniref:natural resistance-associated macrophage protein-domain-containing protein n=1 Tax=Zychaea mexicana TaxID=64656 RepID=UPI0022FDDE2E|nr:natural resistance-associated macrophage protein-domain-containing protein [Zychaea mexicana]KAI9497820.1 natural resistance-associated macrophage protein-domain-containing protein [Zychaea mexicana]